MEENGLINYADSQTKSLTREKSNLFNLEPAQMVKYASSIATALKDVIETQNLYTIISGKKYVKVEGWTTLGAMLGVMPSEEWVKEHEDGSYEAKVNLVKQTDGTIIGGASAICCSDEKRWSGGDKFARRSMAITRATGKAYRLGFSWILSLAGYEPTPEEEMPVYDVKSKRPPASIYTGADDQMEKLQKYLVENDVPEALLVIIHDRLMNRPTTELKKIIREVMSEAN